MGRYARHSCQFLALAAVLSAAPLSAESLFSFKPAPALQATLQMDIDPLTRKRADDAYPGTLTLADGSAFDVEVTKRGKSRQENCRFPPLWLNFKKKQVAGTVLDGQNKLKLVTHCEKKYEPRGYLAAEMLAYRVLNLFTERSFRVRAVDMTYADVDSDRSEQHWSFLIEHKNQLEERLDAVAVDVQKVPRSSLNTEYAGLISVFQYLMGNTDYSFLAGPSGDDCCHNIVPMVPVGANVENGPVYPVPYDFDSSGFVNPPYSAPVASLPIRRLTQRLYRGYCSHNDASAASVQTFVAQKQALFDLIDNYREIPDLSHSRVRKFVEKFYQDIEDPKRLDKRILQKCR